jgi:hypothetical protein
MIIGGWTSPDVTQAPTLRDSLLSAAPAQISSPSRDREMSFFENPLQPDPSARTIPYPIETRA